MADDEAGRAATHSGAFDGRKGSKRQRAEERRWEARAREMKKRALRISLISLIVVVPVLWAFDMSGEEEVVEAVVIQTQRYSHYNQQAGTHFHLRASILVDGRSEQQVERADGYERGQRIDVWAKRGRISGWPYFNDVVKPGEFEPGVSKETGQQLGSQSGTATNAM